MWAPQTFVGPPAPLHDGLALVAPTIRHSPRDYRRRHRNWICLWHGQLRHEPRSVSHKFGASWTWDRDLGQGPELGAPRAWLGEKHVRVVKLMFVLKDEVVIQGSDALAEGIDEMLNRGVEIINTKLAGVFG